MKELLAYIDAKKQAFSQLPLFAYLQDDSIDPIQRLAFAPCAAPFVMGFGELNRNVLRDPASTDPLQKIINHHTHQDAHHWVWFLEDLEKLNLNPRLNFRDALSSLWSEEVAAARQLVYELYRLTHRRSPLQRLVAIEVLEATGNAFFTVSTQLVSTLERSNQQQYRYFGGHHLAVETGHTYCSTDAQDYIANLEVSATERSEQLVVIDQIFEAFAAFANALLVYAQNHPVDTNSPSKSGCVGTYLCEAGLITGEQWKQALAEQQSQRSCIEDILTQHGWVTQQTIDFLITHVVHPQPTLPMPTLKPLVFSN